MSVVGEDELKNFLTLFNGDIAAAKKALSDYESQQASVFKSSNSFTNQSEVIVSANNISKNYKIAKQKIKALSDVSLTIGKGEFVAITGASGSGKSTLLHILGCLDKPTNGEVVIDGNSTASLSDRKLSDLRQKTIGFIFQSFYLQPFLRLNDNVAVPAMFTDTKKNQIDSKVALLLRQVGLDDQAGHFPKELSGGQTQRAAIARSLINNPRIILADEPTGNLDSVNSQSIINLFKAIRNKLGTTIIIVTHDKTIAAQADRIIAMKDGKVI